MKQSSQATCPHCHNVTTKRVAALYETTRFQADARFAPPAPPRERSYLSTPIIWGVVIETITLFAVMIICASNHFSFLAYILAVVGIWLPLILSTVAFRRMLAAAKRRAPSENIWAEAMTTWNRLRYCPVDEKIFDPLGTVPAALPHQESQPQLPGLKHQRTTILPSVA
jgi:uncharacterized paraquat-inducible protein A